MDLLPNGLVNVQIVIFLRKILNPANVQALLDRTGFYVDVMPLLESKLKQTFPNNETRGLITWIKNNPIEFFNGNAEDVTRKINNYLVLDPYILEFLGFSIPIYTDPYHLRMYAFSGVGLIVGYNLLYNKKRK
jgi:hypothetical protein